MQTALIAIIGACAGGALIFFLMKGSSLRADHSGIEASVSKALNDSLLKAQEHLLSLAKERLESERAGTKEDLENKKEMIGALVSEIRKDIERQSKDLEKTEATRIASFSSLAKELELQRTAIGDLRSATDELKRVLSNNQMRGAFGEHVADNLLKMAGFVVGQDYIINHEQDSMETRPDVTLYLPDRTKVNIDVKFPYSALVKMFAVQDKNEQEVHKKAFVQDVKQKIKQVTERGYINPEEKTVDFVILFIPNEMIFSYIYEQLTDVWEDAMQKKVILAGPFSFTAILRMIKQAYSNFRYQENLYHVIGLIQKFEIEYDKYREAVDTLGSRIDSASKQFGVVASTRDRALGRIVDQIKSSQDFSESKKQTLLEE